MIGLGFAARVRIIWGGRFRNRVKARPKDRARDRDRGIRLWLGL